MDDFNDVLFEEKKGKGGSLGIIILNRPRVLNALNHQMFLALDNQLKKWSNDKNIKAVIVKAAEGRAFCAGGDIRHAYERGKAKDPTLLDFFRDEYRVNSRIFHYPKPYLALLDGITMGGGAGISMHGNYRIGTERLSFAMPETGIGLFPDIGASYFLPRLPHYIGFYLGLTGERISYQDCKFAGIVTHIIQHQDQEALIQALIETSFQNVKDKALIETINHFSKPVDFAPISEHVDTIQQCFSKNSVEEILEALEDSTEWGQQMATIIKKKSPTSLKVTLKELQEGAKLNFDACMQMEFRLVSRFVQEHDFYEGVRAVVIDKDQNPQWDPATLDMVAQQEVAKYFAPLKEEFA